MNVDALKTSRLHLRSVTREDSHAIVNQANDWNVARRLARMPYPYTLQDAEFFFDEICPNEFVWAITSADAGFMGLIGLLPMGAQAELGYWLGSRFWGLGYATEACSAVVPHALEELSFKRLAAGFFKDNPASGHVLSKVGFTYENESLKFCLAEASELPFINMSAEQQSGQPIAHCPGK